MFFILTGMNLFHCIIQVQKGKEKRVNEKRKCVKIITGRNQQSEKESCEIKPYHSIICVWPLPGSN